VISLHNTDYHQSIFSGRNQAGNKGDR